MLAKAAPLEKHLAKLAEIRAKFDELDSDGSGGLDGGELGVLVGSMTKGLSAAQLGQAVRAIDRDGR
eukprot:SAG22_NODE_317_length_12513_cov_41.467214_16_plen_67_part_00